MLNTINLTNEQVEYIYLSLINSIKNIKDAYENNLIFHEFEQIEANEQLKMIDSIIKQLKTVDYQQ